MFTQFFDPGLEPLSAFGRSFADSIYVVGAGTLGYALLMLLRPILVRQPASAAERARARAMVEAHGHTSLARCALFNDKGYVFSAGGSVIAYVAKGGIALALGDPIGPLETWRRPSADSRTCVRAMTGSPPSTRPCPTTSRSTRPRAWTRFASGRKPSYAWTDSP